MDRDEGRSAFLECGAISGSVRLSLESEFTGKGVTMSVEDEAEAGEGCSDMVLRSPIDDMARVEAKYCGSRREPLDDELGGE